MLASTTNRGIRIYEPLQHVPFAYTLFVYTLAGHGVRQERGIDTQQMHGSPCVSSVQPALPMLVQLNAPRNLDNDGPNVIAFKWNHGTPTTYNRRIME